MNDREPPGYDDWFDEPEPPTLEAGRGVRQPYDSPAEEDDVWMLPEDRSRRPRRRGQPGGVVIGGRALTRTQIAIIVLALLAMLTAIIAAAGGFSRTPAANPPTITTQHTLPTTETTPTTPTVTAPTQQLHEGETGPQVRLLQKALIALNYLQPPADGSFGPTTKSAVMSFQSANALTPDGVVGDQTLKALRQQLGG